MTEVATSKGKVTGVTKKECHLYFDIPYRQGVSGSGRFTVGEEVAAWGGVRDASKGGLEVVQASLGDLPIPGPKVPLGKDGIPVNMKEEALIVNVFTTDTTPTTPKPVMVWIHGGAFEHGSANNPMYDGSQLAKTQGVVVVSMNYRLGCMGFLYKKGATWQSNLGIHDQINGLKWVQNEVHAFGGDPAKVTIFGESAGAMSVTTLVSLSDSVTRGLFRGAICQSGAGCASIPLDQADRSARMLCEELGITIDELTLEYLQKLPTPALRNAETAMRKKATHTLMPWSPVITDEIPFPLHQIQKGVGREIAVLSGCTRDEFNLFMMGMKGKMPKGRALKYLEKRMSTMQPSVEKVTQVAERITQATGKDGRDLYSKVCTDWLFGVPHERLLDAHGGKSFSYRFDWESPLPKMKSCHALEIPFVFGTHVHPVLKMFAGKGRQADLLSHIIMSSWGAFARTLNPSTAATGVWPTHDSLSRPTMVFGAEKQGTAVLKRNLRSEELAAWEGVLSAKL